MMKYIITYLLCALCWSQLLAQKPNTDSIRRLQLSVREDMLNLKVKGLKKEQIYSASKTLEDFINSPVSATVITRKMIEQTGATSIPEALRLAPGLWVTQKTNGNYDVHIRGDQTAPGSLLQDTKNGQLMVVINHAPQYDYLFGGILWEALPVAIDDVERIEVVRTPSAVFFGTAAITGVVHIFTNTVQDNDLKLDINAQVGAMPYNVKNGNKDLSFFNGASLSFGVSDKLRFRFSGNYQSLKRSQDTYYLLSENKYVESDSLLFYKQNVIETNLNTKLAQERLGVNGFVFYNPSSKIFITSQLSFQGSHAQTVQTDDTLALAQRKSSIYGINVNAYVHNFHFNGSYHGGKRDYALGYSDNEYRVEQLQASLNYRMKYKGITLQPGAGFLQAQSISVLNPDSVKVLTDYYAFVRTDLNPLPKLRIMASIRGDIYEQQDKPYLSYQISSSYKIGTHFLRGSYTYNQGLPLVRQVRQNSHHTLLPNLRPNTNRVAELGWNAIIVAKIRASAEIFYNQGNYNYTSFDSTANTTDQPSLPNTFALTQAGASAQVSVWLNKFQVGGFLTMQRSGQTLAQLSGDGLKNTPQFYGGFQLNYNGLLNKLTANANVYFYNQYNLTTQYQTLTIPAKTLLNIKVSYKIWNENSIFFNARNALNISTTEYAYADNIAGMYLVGLKITM